MIWLDISSVVCRHKVPISCYTRCWAVLGLFISRKWNFSVIFICCTVFSWAVQWVRALYLLFLSWGLQYREWSDPMNKDTSKQPRMHGCLQLCYLLEANYLSARVGGFVRVNAWPCTYVSNQCPMQNKMLTFICWVSFLLDQWLPIQGSLLISMLKLRRLTKSKMQYCVQSSAVCCPWYGGNHGPCFRMLVIFKSLKT